jgi:heat shock protein HtpX
MVVVGVATMALYAAGATLSYALMRPLWTGSVPLGTLVVYLSVLTVVMGYLSYRFGTRQLLSEVRAAPLSRATSPRLYRRLDALSDRYGIDPPRLFVAQLATPNAFALGSPGNAVVVVDRSLFRLLDAAEFEAILAHELAHVARYDGLVQTIGYSTLRTVTGLVLLFTLPVTLLVTGAARALAWIRGRPFEWSSTFPGQLRNGVAVAISVALFALTLPLLAYSRRREFAADARAVRATGNPAALALALRKIDRASRPGWGLLSTLYVSSEDDDPLTRLLSTHPRMDDRIERLREMSDHRQPRVPKLRT